MPDEEGAKPSIRRAGASRAGSSDPANWTMPRTVARETVDQEEARADFWNYVFNTTTFVGGPSMDLDTAAYECDHGRLKGDPTPACGCWAGEAPVSTLYPPQVGRGTGKAA